MVVRPGRLTSGRAKGLWEITWAFLRGPFKGAMNKFTNSESQCKGISLKIAWVIHEADLMTDFGVSARQAGIYWNFPWGRRCWQLLFSLELLCFTLLPPSHSHAGWHQF